MKFRLHDEFTIETTLTQEQAFKALLSHTDAFKTRIGILDRSPYHGEISSHDFRFKVPVPRSLLLLITGRFLAEQPGTNVSIRISLHPGSSAILVIPVGLCILFLAVTCCVGEAGLNALWEIPAFAFFWLFLVYALFWDHAMEQKEILTGIFRNAEGEETADPSGTDKADDQP